jgi:23S rRNA (cytosine1962-C5)-methyltransferase
MDIENHGFAGWELLDSGDGRKLERFGDLVLDRPSPQAIWPTSPGAPWDDAAARFARGEGGTGDWETRGAVPEGWTARRGALAFEIRLTGFGNVGLFPEHAGHFDWLAANLEDRRAPEVLNLFAYTGGASIACALAGARVTHVDAARSVNGWARANATASGVPDGAIRYLADDAVKLVKRELRRQRRYDGIIIDPPTFGRGTKGEVWKIERDLFALLELCGELLGPEPAFLLLTSHSPGVTPRVCRSLLASFGGTVDAGEMLLVGAGRPLPAGCHARWTP